MGRVWLPRCTLTSTLGPVRSNDVLSARNEPVNVTNTTKRSGKPPWRYRKYETNPFKRTTPFLIWPLGTIFARRKDEKTAKPTDGLPKKKTQCVSLMLIGTTLKNKKVGAYNQPRRRQM